MKVKDLIAHLVKMDAGDAEVCVGVTNCISAYAADPMKLFPNGFRPNGFMQLFPRAAG